MDQHVEDELVAYRSESVSKVKEGDVQWSLHVPHVFNDGSHGGNVLHNPIHASQEACLCGGVGVVSVWWCGGVCV